MYRILHVYYIIVYHPCPPTIQKLAIIISVQCLTVLPVVFVDVPKIDLFVLPKAFVLPENKLVPDVPLLPNKPPVVPVVPNPPNPPREV